MCNYEITLENIIGFVFLYFIIGGFGGGLILVHDDDDKEVVCAKILFWPIAISILVITFVIKFLYWSSIGVYKIIKNTLNEKSN